MADKYISAEAAAENLRNYKIERDLMVSYNDTIDFSISVISAEVTAADVVEVVRGKWINGNCDQCGAHAPFWCMASTYYTSNFCPNCGADMRETGR